jgi:hypothetical protein
METGYTKWIDALKSIPEFKEEVEALQEKYSKFPPGTGLHKDDATRYKEQNDFVEKFYGDVLSLDQTIRDWLKKEYPEETNDKTLFWGEGYYPYGGTPVESYGLDVWVRKTCKPADHGGYPGAQWGFDCSIQGKLTKLCPALSQAYRICKTAREEKIKKKEAEEKRKQEEREKWRKQQEAIWQKNWQKTLQSKMKYRKQDAVSLLTNAMIDVTNEFEVVYDKKMYTRFYLSLEDMFGKERAKEWLQEIHQAAQEMITSLANKWTRLLQESISMHWFPERIEKGIRRPGEWKPDFNLDVVAKMETTCGKVLAHRIKAEAWKKGAQQRELLELFHEKVKE